jgi:hypothetical protein
MTKREFLMEVAKIENEELAEFAQAELKKMDDANEKRKEKTSKKAEENQPLVDRIVNEILGTEPKTASDVAAILEVSVQKASSLCKAAVAQEKAVQSEVKIPKKGPTKVYTKA